MEIAKDEVAFRATYPTAEKHWAKSGVSWSELEAIRSDHLARVSSLQNTANAFATALQEIEGVHSTRVRVKHPDHVIEKIVRKRAEGKDITLENYRERLTDLIGARALHLFKDNWVGIHDTLVATWEEGEPPKAYIRQGDPTALYDRVPVAVEVHPKNYRSVHYIFKTNFSKDTHPVEVQVRTLAEEAWGEIDHSVRYPYFEGDPALELFCALLSRLTGSVDELASLISFERQEALERNIQIDELRAQTEQLEATTQEQEKTIADIKKELTQTAGKLATSEQEKKKMLAQIESIPESPRQKNQTPTKPSTSSELTERIADIQLKALKALYQLDSANAAGPALKAFREERQAQREYFENMRREGLESGITLQTLLRATPLPKTDISVRSKEGKRISTKQDPNPEDDKKG